MRCFWKKIVMIKYCMSKKLLKIFENRNLKGLDLFLQKRVLSIASLAFLASFITVLQPKIWGVELDLFTIGIIGFILNVPKIFIFRFKDLSLVTIRNAFIVCDGFEALGYFSYGFSENAKIMIVCIIISQVINSLVAGVYFTAIEDYVSSIANKNFRSFKAACLSYGALAGLVGSIIMCILINFLSVQYISLIIGVICTGTAIYTNHLVNELIRRETS